MVPLPCPRPAPSDMPNPFRFNGFARDGSRLLLLLPCNIDIGFKPELYCHLFAEVFYDSMERKLSLFCMIFYESLFLES